MTDTQPWRPRPYPVGSAVGSVATTASASSFGSFTLIPLASWALKTKFLPRTRKVGSPPQASMSTCSASGSLATIASRRAIFVTRASPGAGRGRRRSRIPSVARMASSEMIGNMSAFHCSWMLDQS